MKSKVRRQVFSLLLSLCMTLALLPAAAPVQATDDPPVVGSIVKDVGIENFYEDYADEIAAVAAGLEQMAETIDLSEFNLTFTDINELGAIAGALYNAAQSTHPEYFWTDKDSRLGYYSIGSTFYLSSITPTYKDYTEADLTEMKAAFAAQAEYYLAMVRDNPDICDSGFYRALLLHDELALDAAYVLENDNYAFMVDKEGLCENYSRIYAYLLSQLGFSCELVDSATHEWIKVDLDGDGVYYNVDLTFDDPTPNQPGRVRHTYFLLSDDAIRQETTEHGTFSCIHASDNDSYDSNLIHNYTSKLCKVSPGNTVYGINSNGLMEFEFYDFWGEGGSEVPKDAVDFSEIRWPAGEEGYCWDGIFSGLDFFDGFLYFNTPQEIRRYDISYNRVEPVCSYEDYGLPDGEYFYGLHIRGNTLYASVAPDPNTAGTEYELMELQPQLPAQVYGHSLSLDGRIGVNTYLLFNHDVDLDQKNYQVEFYEGETLVSATLVEGVAGTLVEWNGNDIYAYPFTVTAASNQMDTVFTMKFRKLDDDSFVPFANIDGSPVDADIGLDYSIQDYLDEAEVSGSGALQTLASDMRNFGVFAKHYFLERNEGSTEDLPVIEGFEPVEAETLSAYVYEVPAEIDGFRYQGTSLLLEDDTALRMYFESDDVASLTIVYDGKELDIVPGQGMYYVQISDIGAPQLSETFLFSISNGSDDTTAVLGPMGYAHLALSGDDVRDSLRYLMMALFHYNQSAYAYFSN